jgi:hypothetical protein
MNLMHAAHEAARQPSLAAVQRLFASDDIADVLGSESPLYFPAESTTAAELNGPVGVRVNMSGVAGMPNASQATTSLCPILRETPVTKRRWLEAPDADDALNLTFAIAPGECDVGVLNGDGSFTWTRPTLGTTVNVLTRFALNAFWIMRQRAFDAPERALIERYARRHAPLPGEWS